VLRPADLLALLKKAGESCLRRGEVSLYGHAEDPAVFQRLTGILVIDGADGAVVAEVAEIEGIRQLSQPSAWRRRDRG